MIFQFTIDQLLTGQKNQTRRLVQDGDKAEVWENAVRRRTVDGTQGGDVWALHSIHCVTTSTGRIKWRVGGRYAVQAGRGKKGVGYIRITRIRREIVSDITNEDARAEGFTDRKDYLRTFKIIHPTVGVRASVWVLDFEVVP